MRTVAVVPINILTSAKSRLAAYLTEDHRRELVFWMAGIVLASLKTSGLVEQIAVVSPDPQVLSWAKACGAHPLHQKGSGLNAGLDLGRDWAHRARAEALLVLLGDLPYLTPDEVINFLRIGTSHPVVLAPDRLEQGTNGLLLHLATDMPFAFGGGSLGRHLALAREECVTPVLFHAPGIGFDVDTFAELSMLYEFGIWMPEDHDEPPLGVGCMFGGGE